MPKRYDEAIAAYDCALQFQPNFPQTLLLRGITLAQAKRYTEAVETYDKLLEIQPKNAKVFWFK